MIVPGSERRTLISTVASDSSAIVPSTHVTVPLECEQVPCEGVAESYVTPAGSVSVSWTPVAPSGPELWAVRVYVRSWPASTGSGESVFVSDRLATGSTVVDALALLLTRTGSVVVADTVAWLVICPAVSGVTEIATLAPCPFAIVPSAHVTVPLECEHVP